MGTSEVLARHHRQVLDRFIGSALDGLDLRDMERNVVGVAIRREVEEGLVPGLAAVQALIHAADASRLGKQLPEWLDSVSSLLLTAEGELMAETGQLD